MNIYIYLVICIIICIILYFKYYNWGNNIKILNFESFFPGPNLLIISGTHGNEPAGQLVIEECIKNGYFKQKIKYGKIYIISRSNKSGSMFGLRYMLHNFLFPDLNRNYTDDGKEPVSQKIIKLIKNKKIDFIIDFHEGWGFHKINYKSIGSTLSSTTSLSTFISLNIINSLNKHIKEEEKKFVLNDKKDDLFTLRNYASRNRLNYILVETTGQDNIQKIDIRKKQVMYIIDSFFNIFYKIYH